MKKSDHEWRKRGIFLLVVLLMLPLLAAGYRMIHRGVGRAMDGFFYPYLELSRIATDKLADRSLLAYSRAELAAKLEQLLQENRRLALQSSNAAGILQENRELRQLLKLKPPPGWRFSVAEIIIRDPILRQESFTINQGTNQRVVPGAAIVDLSADGRMLLVGVVEQVYPHTSKVVTIFNSTLRISGKLKSNGAVGFLNIGEVSAGAGRVRYGFLPENCTYIPGEAVVTTGYEKGIPAGIKIGEFYSAMESSAAFANSPGYLSGELTPSGDFNRLRFVVVLNPQNSSANL